MNTEQCLMLGYRNMKTKSLSVDIDMATYQGIINLPDPPKANEHVHFRFFMNQYARRLVQPHQNIYLPSSRRRHSYTDIDLFLQPTAASYFIKKPF